MTASWAGLADALSCAPDLEGAACVGRWALFDPRADDETPEDAQCRHQAALSICATCPIFDDCSSWAASLGPCEVMGVLAGVNRTRPNRKAALPLPGQVA